LAYVAVFFKKSPTPSDNKDDKKLINLVFLVNLFYAAYYYGGLYQYFTSIAIGQIMFFIFLFYLGLCVFLLKKPLSLPMIILFYVVISLWTIHGSPNPRVDTIVVLKEAPLKFIQGKNPYNSQFSRVYANIEPTYYNYLPFSFIYFMPFVRFLSDPRYGIVSANLISAILLYLIFKKTKDKDTLKMFVAMFLFLPRSFYMLEHVYLDSVIFTFFLGFYHLSQKKFRRLASFFLGLMFSFKQNIFLIFPYFFNKPVRRRLNYVFLILPFLLAVYFFAIDKNSFLNNTVFNLSPKSITSPIDYSLTLPTFIKSFALPNKNVIYNVSFVIFAIVYVVVLLFSKRKRIENSLAITVLLFNYFSYHAFFNNYYLAVQFLLFEIACLYFNSFLTAEKQPPLTS
jgi:hypothetical protein